MAAARRLARPRLQLRSEPFHRQADHVAVRARYLLDDQIALLLNRVGAGLVQRVDPAEVSPDAGGVEGAKGDRGTLGEHRLPMTSQVHQADASEHLMRAAL